MAKIIFKSLFAFFFGLNSAIVSSQENDFKVIKNRIYQVLISNDSNLSFPYTFTTDEELEKTLNEFDGEKWPSIDYEDVSRENFDNRIHTRNLVILASSYKNVKSKYFKNSKVKRTIISALKFWCENDFIGENWWNNQIGTPNDLVHLMLIIGDELPNYLILKSQKIISRANISSGGSRPGGDRIKVCSIAAKNQLFLNDIDQFNHIMKIIESEIKFVSWIGKDFGYTFTNSNAGGLVSFKNVNGRGLQYGNSFHHRTDGVNNTLSYGYGYAKGFIEWAHLNRGTKFSFSNDKIKMLIDYFLDGIAKTSVFGKYPDFGAKNRSISRKGSLNTFNGSDSKKLIEISDYRKKELNEIFNLRTEKRDKTSISHATFYWSTEHFAFQRPDFYASVRMYSTRNMNMESPYNSEGFLNHHRGDGTNYVYTRGNEYYDISPVYDYMRIPGATIVQKDSLHLYNIKNELKKIGLKDYVGAVTDGYYGAVGYDFQSSHDPLVARKSWFFFDNEYVCLGAGISTKMNNEVNTTLNQTLLNGQVLISSNGKNKIIERGEQEYKNLDWIYHDNVAYLFPKPQTVSVKNNFASGSWWRINNQGDSSKDKVELGVFKSWINHGVSPSNASYQYIVKPNVSPEKINITTTLKNIEILSNTPYLQAVKNNHLDIVQIIFYKGGEVQISDELILKSSTPGIVMLKLKGNKISEISVSDPNRELLQMNFTVNQKIVALSNGFRSNWLEDYQFSQLIIDLPSGNFLGSSKTIKL